MLKPKKRLKNQGQKFSLANGVRVKHCTTASMQRNQCANRFAAHTMLDAVLLCTYAHAICCEPLLMMLDTL